MQSKAELSNRLELATSPADEADILNSYHFAARVAINNLDHSGRVVVLPIEADLSTIECRNAAVYIFTR